MPRYDPDTIAALAEGRLDPEEATRVEREIAQDPAALADLEMHRSVLAAMSDAPPIVLSELERAGLRANVANSLGLVDASPSQAPAARRVPWGSLGIAAAALFGLVAVVPVVGLLNTANDDAASTALSPVATSTAGDLKDATQESDESAGAPTAAITEDGSFNADQEAPGEDIAAFGSTTTQSRSTTTAAAETTGTDDTSTTIEEAPLVDPDFAQLVLDLTALREDPGAMEGLGGLADQETLCWVEDTAARGGEDPGDRLTFEYDDGSRVVVVYFQADPEGLPGPFSVYKSTDCAPVVVVPPSS